jgi:carbon-monoxide dehydrogenase large subunit
VGGAARSAGGEVDRGPARALRLLGARARPGAARRVGFDDDGRLLGLDVRFWHDNGAYTPYGVIVPIITSTQLLGPYKPGAYRWSSTASTPTPSS